MKRGKNPLRFAVAVFDSAGSLDDAILHLGGEGVGREQLSCLGLSRVLSAVRGEPGLLPPWRSCEIPFPAGVPGISCTPGPIASFLAARVDAGAPTLAAALGHSLIPRHAAQIQEAVERGAGVVWVQLSDGESERRVCRSLLGRAATSVGVHDLIDG